MILLHLKTGLKRSGFFVPKIKNRIMKKYVLVAFPYPSGSGSHQLMGIQKGLSCIDGSFFN